MTLSKKSFFKGLALFVSGLAIGVSIGYTKIAPFVKWYTMSSTGNGMAAYAEVQYYKAKYSAAIKAQNEYLAYLRAVEKKKAEWDTWAVPWMTEQFLNYERTVTYARIAILEGREGRTPEADKSWQDAEKYATAAGWKSPSRDHILKVLTTKEAEYKKSEENVQPRP